MDGTPQTLVPKDRLRVHKYFIPHMLSAMRSVRRNSEVRRRLIVTLELSVTRKTEGVAELVQPKVRGKPQLFDERVSTRICVALLNPLVQTLLTVLGVLLTIVIAIASR